MNGDRLDALLDEAIATGVIPGQATEAERAEVEGLLEAMGLLAPVRSMARAEAEASLPTARARFQRHVAENRPGEPARAHEPSSRPHRLPWGRLVPRGVTAALAGSAAAIGVIAVAAVLAWQMAFNSTTSAYAQVVEPGDYVQVEGVIEETGDGSLSLRSALGEVDVELQEGTTVVDAQTARDASTLKRGDRILVSGIAGEGRKLLAQTLALGEEDGGPRPRLITFKQLERLRPHLEGEVVTYTISSDGLRGAVLIDAGEGERYLVPVDGPSASRLLARASTVLGQRVTVAEESGVTSGTFTLDVPLAPQRPDATDDASQPALVSVQGVVANVRLRPASTDSGRILEGLVTVETKRGPVVVVIRAGTRVFPGESALAPGAGLRGEANGHAISVSGGLDKNTGEVVADVIVMGPKVGRPAR